MKRAEGALNLADCLFTATWTAGIVQIEEKLIVLIPTLLEAQQSKYRVKPFLMEVGAAIELVRVLQAQLALLQIAQPGQPN